MIEARGDIFIASQLVGQNGFSPLRMRHAIDASDVLKAVLQEIKSAGSEATEAQIRQAIESRLSLYKVVGLDSLYELATMPIDANSAQNQVRLAAAARLAGSIDSGVGGGDLADAMREMRELYDQNAPRIRVIRQTSVEIDNGRVVSEQSRSSEPHPPTE